ncbi:MAG: FAD:protein FMN transferase, partial [Myxococcales bacterium]|nr:FAD:protein FMN transferase [Myxococcales bacterium]
LGGIAKGYAIDKAAAVLKAHGLRAFIVDGGGDLFIAGEKAPGVPWTVGVQHPRADRVLLALPARDQAVVSSGDYERFFELGGRRYHHILDPKTGLPAGKSVAVTVRAPDATRADALATALFVLGPVEGLALAQAQGVDAAILGPDGAIAVTAGLAELFPKRWKD